MSSHHYDAFTERLTAACEADTRIAAAFICGSRVTGAADTHADVDPYLILRDDAYDGFFAERRPFMEQLGDALFLEDFNGFGFDMLLFIYADGVEGELVFARASDFAHIPHGPFRTLLDRDGILPAQPFPPIPGPPDEQQKEELRWFMQWFWRDLSQLARWLARGKLWNAYGNLEMARHTCVSIARLKHDWSAAPIGFFKLDGAVEPDDLACFQDTFCKVERQAILDAARRLIAIYQQLAPPLAAGHDIPYPSRLGDVVTRRLDEAAGEVGGDG